MSVCFRPLLQTVWILCTPTFLPKYPNWAHDSHVYLQQLLTSVNSLHLTGFGRFRSSTVEVEVLTFALYAKDYVVVLSKAANRIREIKRKSVLSLPLPWGF